MSWSVSLYAKRYSLFLTIRRKLEKSGVWSLESDSFSFPLRVFYAAKCTEKSLSPAPLVRGGTALAFRFPCPRQAGISFFLLPFLFLSPSQPGLKSGPCSFLRLGPKDPSSSFRFPFRFPTLSLSPSQPSISFSFPYFHFYF